MPRFFRARRRRGSAQSMYDAGGASPSLRPLSAAGLVGAVVLAWGAAVAPVAGAQDAGDAGENASGGDSQAAIIMDASSSMLEPDEGGSRMDVAKRAATELVDSLPETANVGMLAYGTQVGDAPENHERGCQDIRTLSPVGRVDKDGLKSEIDGLQAQGYTPIGNALRAAGDALEGGGDRSIILVSDGIDTCAPPPPCEVAKELAGEGIGLAVHVVGFKADEATREELECIANETGGSYRQADDAAALSESLQFLTQRAMETYETAGTDFEFANEPDDAKYLGAGLYKTEVDTEPGRVKDAQEQLFRIAVPEGMNARVAVTALPEITDGVTDEDPEGHLGGQGVGVNVDATNESDSDCSYRPTSSYESTMGGGFSTVGSAELFVDGDDVDGCAMDQWTVTSKFSSNDLGGESRAERIPVEVSVQFEPVLSDAEEEALPAGSPGSADDPQDLPFTAATPVEGGNSFGNATPITEGTYSDSLVPGETRFYSYPVEWGQRPQVTVKALPSARDEAESLSLGLYGPMRNKIAGENVPFYDKETIDNIVVDRPINYNNRGENQGGKERALAGTHYFAVSMDVRKTELAGVDQPFEFALAAPGEPADGPDWEPVNEPGPEPSDTPPSSSGEETNESDGGEANTDADDVTATAAGEDGGANMWLVVGGGLIAVLAALAVLGVVLFSRGKRGPTDGGQWGQPGAPGQR